MEVYVITNVESGWDCVVGVYCTYDDAKKLCAEYDNVNIEDWDENNSTYIIHEKTM